MLEVQLNDSKCEIYLILNNLSAEAKFLLLQTYAMAELSVSGSEQNKISCKN